MIAIKDDEGWEPDEDFFVYLYDINDVEKKQLFGDNTRTKVTILDDDKPGIISFSKTDVRVKRSDKVAVLHVVRQEGSDGDANIVVQNTEVASCPYPAKEGIDFKPISKELSFAPGVCE
jgi:solute carrier family 8 (sodium/calcium exchanger)